MPRTTSELVAAIIEVDVNIPLDPFISVANELVTEICVPAGYGADRLELIERWLSAHFYTNRDPRPTREEAGPVSASYQSKLALNLGTSHYGQTAMMLDTAGGLAQLSSAQQKRTLSVTWLGIKQERDRSHAELDTEA